jgi:hypothetical protein
MRHYLSVDDLSTTELPQILELAAELKADPSLHTQALSGRSIALIFEKPSTRTRVSFEVGIAELGAEAVVAPLGLGVVHRDQHGQGPGALDVPEEANAKSSPFRRALDNAGNIGHHKRFSVAVSYDAEIWRKCGECIVRNLWLSG